MNYVGSISILDRGHAPAQAIIDKNARSLAQRVADETREELEKVMNRVDNIYESYETSTQALMTQSTMEYVEDIAELEALIKDQLKKKKYQQQVTIFIVGYENVCGQKLRLLQQVNEFFMDNSKSYEEEDWYPKTPDIDVDDCSNKIEESLATAKELTEKISTINSDMVEWLTTYAINKASTKSKKKLESALTKAKDDVKAITDQLKSALLANDEKDELIQTYLKQLEGKTLEAQKFKAAAEVAKKNVQGLEAKELVYQDEIEKRKSAMKQLQDDLRKLQMDVSQSNFLSELNSNRLRNKDSESAECETLQEIKLEELQSVVEKHKLELHESRRELLALHQDQITALHETHKADLETVRLEYAETIKKLQDNLHETKLKVNEAEQMVDGATDAAEQARQELLAFQLSGSTGDSRPTTEIESQPPDAEDGGISRDSSRQESRPSTKDTRSSKGAPAKVTVTRTTPAAKTVTKPSKQESKSPVKPVKETADASIQDEGGDPGSAHAETRQSKRARSTLETVKESDLNGEFDDAFDLTDESSWAMVPVETVPGRFLQYRKMTIRKLSEVEEQLGLTVAKTQRKVTTLKSQFQEHKSKWETERKVLIEQVEQAQKLQTEAEKEADVAMTQLEEFINEQERLEEEEEVKRQEVVKGVSKPVMVSIPTQHDEDETMESEVMTSGSPQTLTPVQPEAETGAPPPTFIQSEESEHELTNLMQQTDDAKVQEIKARKSSGALSAPPAVEPESEPRDKMVRLLPPKAKTQTQIVPKSKTEDEIRATSALSRASLRKEYRNKLGEVRAAVEDRRTKSPAISIPSQRSLEDDQLIDEDDDDDIPYNDIEELKKEQTMEMGTSPPPGQKGQSSSRLSQISGDHPIVTEYLRLYEGVVEFRGILSKLMVDRDMLQPSEILEDIDMMKFNGTGKVEPQLEHMTHNVFHVFEEIITVLSSLLLADREPMVSSLTGGGMMMSRDTTQAMVGPKSAESGRGPTVTRASHHSQFSAKSDVSERIALRELQEQYDRLQHQLTGETRKHDEQLRHNTVVMMEMQDTINDLQRELSNLGRSSSRLRPQSDTTSPHGTTDSAVMFTRLDSERNCKIMKRAVNDQKMEADKYKDALVKMEDYVGLPAQRFAHLVRKYVHHSRMKEIEENVKKSKSLNENVFEILDKMEALQNERAKTWADKMDQMGSERLRLANLLMETLDSIEQESGIFLIKPMYSYRGRDIKDARYGGKLTRPMRSQRNLSPHRENLSSFAPAPTPASNMRLIRGQPVPTTQSMTHEIMPKHEAPRPLEGDEGGITGASLNWVGTSQKQTWSMNSSVVRGDPENFLSSQNPNAMNTPRILELDINRMLIGQNTISSKITQPGLTEDRLVNASQNNLRSYITVNRPTALPGNARPRSFASSATKEFVPPSSPVSQNTKRVRMSDGDMSRTDMSRNMTNTPPLPPIGSASSREIHGEPPRSPPGSSMRQSPPHVQEVISPLK
ncbi:microtubule-associated protein futsch-like isoform X2 [Mizuhopecten yessoensis]|uniref:microtubule-associated protein futsch-like isoform X2 n=1 Tax=Mizuhopecten yessoensis TaxID=6573 RepID=UPI000B4573BC|nr:microtubule-associated protein futsch-like isoform X2 [Mizuhopecten yessoensis]